MPVLRPVTLIAIVTLTPPRKLLEVASKRSPNDAEHPFIVRAISLPTLG